MNVFQLVMLISIVLAIVGFFGYMWEHFEYRVDRWTTWSELTARQWTFVVLGFQCPIVMVALVVITIITR